MKAYTRYNNEELFKRCQEFVPVEVTKLSNYNHWWDAAYYLQSVLMQKDDVAMNIDIDCFVTDWSVVEQLVQDFKEGEYTHAGVSDSAYLWCRANISWAVMNPFFNLFDSDRIIAHQKCGGYTWNDIHEFGFRPEWNSGRPSFVKPYERSQWEPFNGLFNWLYSWGKPLWLEAQLHWDDNSTILKYKGQPFATHTWYSRFYGNDSDQGRFHTKRIDDRYEEALKARKK